MTIYTVSISWRYFQDTIRYCSWNYVHAVWHRLMSIETADCLCRRSDWLCRRTHNTLLHPGDTKTIRFPIIAMMWMYLKENVHRSSSGSYYEDAIRHCSRKYIKPVWLRLLTAYEPLNRLLHSYGPNSVWFSMTAMVRIGLNMASSLSNTESWSL